MKNSVIVITGASAGIGKALGEIVGQRAARSVLVARRERELEESKARSGECIAVVADVTKRSDVERVAATALSHYGQIDVWVNNVGRGISRMVSELTDDDIDQMVTANVKSALYGIQAVLPHMKQLGKGQIINVSSLLGRVPMAPQRSAYSAAKHALNSLTANLRMELAQTHPGIAVSLVHPGIVATEFGSNALHGGIDSRKMPGAQSAEEVAGVIADVIERPRADVYTRPEGQEMVVRYYSAPDMAEAERQFALNFRPR